MSKEKIYKAISSLAMTFVAVIIIILAVAIIKCSGKRADCKMICIEKETKEEMDLCLSKCDIKFNSCDLN
ncbi:MAG: hypothetical protein KAT66_00600 [Candidatus Lokiarchaeota archaeon]|nr:hypothetical protein [Candidatus Lokiarchaeota archaeon]